MNEQLIAKITKAGVIVGGKLSADKTNNEQHYDYLSADKILSVCGQALFDQGVAVLPSIDAQETALYEYVDPYGKAKRRYDSRVSFSFIITDGSEDVRETWYGMGSDYTVPDKALYKAITSGHKYFLMKLLCIGAGNEDGEHETEEDDRKPAQKPTQRPAQPAQVSKPQNATQPAQAPITTEAVPKMSLEMASEVTNALGERYDSLDTDTLNNMANSMQAVLDGKKKSNYSRDEVTFRRDACLTILAHRNG